MAVPSGEVTLLFTDIEGSTRLWETQPEAMAGALRRHDDILRQAIEAHRGYVFKTVGDAFCAAFSSARHAVLAALAAQRQLQAEPWPDTVVLRVRMALHSGRCEERDGDYFGPVVNRTARLEAAGHGGQLLLSAATTAQLRCAPVDGLTLEDLGSHRLKDLTDPEQIFQARAEGLEGRFPPLRTLSNPALRNNLPRQVTSFVGRAALIAEVAGCLQPGGLVTLTGAGGSGKTRLALQVAADAVDGSADGVWFVDLAPLRVEDAVSREVAAVLAVGDTTGESVEERLVEALASKSMLLVLDNCEHVLGSCAALAEHLLRAAPGVALLATSREPLRIAGERVVRVPPLGLPVLGPGLDPLTAITTSESATLFLERARAHAGGGFILDSRVAGAVASICRSLDGLPLALELAAARLRSMTVFELEHRLDDHLRLLRSAARGSLERQQTIGALVDWSYRLLTLAEKTVFTRLSVFAGPFDAKAAATVGSGGQVDVLEADDILFSLVDKSLVLPEPDEETTRYRLLESIRQFAHEQLGRAGPVEHDGARARLVAYYGDLAGCAETELFGPNEPEWIDRLIQEQPNILAALDYANQGIGTDDWGLAIASSLVWFWWAVDNSLGAQVLERALAHDTSRLPPAPLAKGMWALAEQWSQLGRCPEAAAMARAAHSLAVDGGDERVAAHATKLEGLSRAAIGESDSAARLMEEALRLAERCSPVDRAIILHDAGIIDPDPAVCRARLEAALEEVAAVGSPEFVSLLRGNLGALAAELGDLQGAKAILEQVHAGLRSRRRGGNTVQWLVSLSLAEIALLEGDLDAALAHLPNVMATVRAKGTGDEPLLCVAALARAVGDPWTAGRLLGAADALHEATGQADQRHVSQLRMAGHDALQARPDSDLSEAYAVGRRLNREAALTLAESFVAEQTILSGGTPGAANSPAFR